MRAAWVCSACYKQLPCKFSSLSIAQGWPISVVTQVEKGDAKSNGNGNGDPTAITVPRNHWAIAATTRNGTRGFGSPRSGVYSTVRNSIDMDRIGMGVLCLLQSLHKGIAVPWRDRNPCTDVCAILQSWSYGLVSRLLELWL